MDPLKKGSPGFRDPLTRGGKGGSIGRGSRTAGEQSTRSRIIVATLCLVPYLGLGIFLFVSGLKLPAVMLLGVPLFLGLLFWFVVKNSDM